jgi:hypothetical protein
VLLIMVREMRDDICVLGQFYEGMYIYYYYFPFSDHPTGTNKNTIIGLMS